MKKETFKLFFVLPIASRGAHVPLGTLASVLLHPWSV